MNVLRMEFNLDYSISLGFASKIEDKGGWANRDILDWFLNYVDFCTKEFGSKVNNWMVMNEPAAFVGIGYMMGYHAPGKKSVIKFLKATHHVCLAMAEGGRKIRENVLHSNIGTTFSCSHIDPYRKGLKDKRRQLIEWMHF